MKPRDLLSLFLFAPLLAAQDPVPLLEEAFDYVDGPLSGQGAWTRGVTSPSADNPSLYIAVEGGAVKFDWTTLDPINNAVRVQWEEAQMTEGMIYASFTIRATQAPQAEPDVRPGFFTFDRSGGGQMRGHVGIRSGTDANTYQLGISPSSQGIDNFSFAEDDLQLNVDYQVMVGYNVATSETFLWLGTTDPKETPLISAIGTPGTGVRRINLRLYNSNGAGGTTNLGIFYIDNLKIIPGPAPDPGPDPEPDTSEVFLTETFAYDEGLLLDSAPDWRIREGTPAHAVSANRLQLVPGSGYITRNLSRSVDSGEVYTAVTLDLPAVPQVHSPVNVLFLTDASGAFGRAFLVLEGTSEGWRIGVRGSSSGEIAWAAGVLPAGTSSRWVSGYNLVTGSTGLWGGSDALDALPRAEAAGTIQVIRRAAIGADPAMPVPPLLLRDVHIASTRARASSTPIDLVALPHRDKVYLFLLIGQSNMAGRGKIEAEDLIGTRRIAFYNADRQWQVARDPLHWDRPGYTGVGPALSFARELLKALPPDAVIGLIPAAQGGTSINWWQKGYAGANVFYDGQYLYPHALGRALEVSQVGTLSGILWNQGESDASAAETDNGASYRTRLHSLITDLRTDLALPELPFIVSTLGPWRTNSTAINNVFLSLPSEVPNTATVNTLDPEVAPYLLNNPSDTPHYISSSYRLLGRLYAETFSPWWNPSPAYVSEVAGRIRAGSTSYRIDFTTTGGLSGWEVVGHSLFPSASLSTGQWFLQDATAPESLGYSANPPLSFKWRSPRTMAAWTVGDASMGLILANNDLFPATFRLSLGTTLLTYFRTPEGDWKPVGEALPDQPVDRLRWDLPDGTLILWSGTGVLRDKGILNALDLEVDLPHKGVADWSWFYGYMPLLNPQAHAVYQRQTERAGRVPLEGIAPAGSTSVAFRIASGSGPFGDPPTDPLVLTVDPVSGAFSGSVEWPAGGWYAVHAMARDGSEALTAEAWIDPVGVGEVFVVAGQSNSTNSGQFQTQATSGLVRAYSGSGWRPATDPMPGTHDNATRGSFQPSMGDAMVERFGVPVAFASTGQGGSGIRHWQPDYVHDFETNTFYNGLYQWTLHRMRQLGPDGFRGLLWHQGESNASQGESTDPEKVNTYYDALSRLLASWRADTGWDFPAFTAKASLWPMANAQYGGDPYLREAQQRIWDDGIAYPGPDTDQLGLEFRQDDSESRVHFNAAGLKLHGELWAQSVGPLVHTWNLQSMLPVMKVSIHTAGLRINWQQTSLQTIRLQSSWTLSGDWTTRDTFITEGAGNAFEVTDPSWDGTTPVFYRLNLE